jgi:hypothetical protein
MPVIGSSSSTKKGRWPKEYAEQIREMIYGVCQEHQRLSVRHAFYQLEGRGQLVKTDKAYRTLQRQIVYMRKNGLLPWDWIVDSTRWMRKPTTYGSLRSMLEMQTNDFRRNLWLEQDAYVEIWCESDSTAGIIHEVTERWDVPLMSSRGFSSVTFTYESAMEIYRQHMNGKPSFIYYFGDHDKQGLHIDRAILKGLKHHLSSEVDLTFERMAITEEQIERFNLSTGYGSKAKSVQLEAMAPETTRDICEQCIVQHINESRYRRCMNVEAAERETLQMFLDTLGGAA